MAEAISPEAEAEATAKHEKREATHCQCGCTDADRGDVVGFCLWCDHVYVKYNHRIENQHFANHCSGAPQELKDSARARLARAEDAGLVHEGDNDAEPEGNE
jgi:hypothetical protein